MNLHPISLALATAALFASSVEAVSRPLLLFEIPVTRFTIDDEARRWSHTGRLDSYGIFRVDSIVEVLSTVSLPPEALNRNLIHEDRWHAYRLLGPKAVDNFTVEEPFTLPVGNRYYSPVAVHPEARYDVGDLINISARAIVTPGGEPLIGGFVIESEARWVLIRAIGPTLKDFGVPTPLADPFLAVYESDSTVVTWYNDDWNQRPDAAEIKQVSARLSAFALPEGSKDAAYLVELPAGAFTAHLTTYGTTGGTALLEIYVLP